MLHEPVSFILILLESRKIFGSARFELNRRPHRRLPENIQLYIGRRMIYKSLYHFILWRNLSTISSHRQKDPYLFNLFTDRNFPITSLLLLPRSATKQLQGLAYVNYDSRSLTSQDHSVFNIHLTSQMGLLKRLAGWRKAQENPHKSIKKSKQGQ